MKEQTYTEMIDSQAILIISFVGFFHNILSINSFMSV